MAEDAVHEETCTDTIINIQFGEQTLFPIFVGDLSKTTLSDLKQIIEVNSGIPRSRQIFLAGLDFEDKKPTNEQEYKSLAVLGVTAGCTIIMIEADLEPAIIQQTQFSLLSSFGSENISNVYENVSFDVAFDAAKKEPRKILFAVLYSSNHEQSVEYCLSLLSSDFVADLVKVNFVLYFVDILHTQVTNLLAPLQRIVERSGKFSEDMLDLQNLPVTAFFWYTQGSTSIIDVIHGVVNQEELVPKLLHLIEIQENLTSNILSLQESNLLNQQDEQYKLAMQQDLEKEAMLEKQKIEQQILQQKLIEQTERLSLERETKKNQLPPEPLTGNITTLKIRLLDGKQIVRKFLQTDSVSLIFDFLFVTYDINPYEIELVSNFPKAIFVHSEIRSFIQCQLVPQCQLFVREKQ